MRGPEKNCRSQTTIIHQAKRESTAGGKKQIESRHRPRRTSGGGGVSGRRRKSEVDFPGAPLFLLLPHRRAGGAPRRIERREEESKDGRIEKAPPLSTPCHGRSLGPHPSRSESQTRHKCRRIPWQCLESFFSPIVESSIRLSRSPPPLFIRILSFLGGQRNDMSLRPFRRFGLPLPRSAVSYPFLPSFSPSRFPR